eukprot:TRINITY_DN1300_c0_g1_i3.p1 TRINITY_DN1300_c0_g1~~TRINITY_DN1300_c0_g1_i3.p1  ORF type:complete len:210 (+),score=35.98 TRINITY_DN1300_c0_g1_i3:57-686(+)
MNINQKMNKMRKIPMHNLKESSPLLQIEDSIKIKDPKPKKSCKRRCSDFIKRKPDFKARDILVNGEMALGKYPANLLRNQKYNIFSFFFLVLYEQFKFFFNLYYLIIALTQFIPALQVGFLFTYVAPLAFVIIITMVKEAYDDLKRWKRDKEVNGRVYRRLTKNGLEDIPASEIKVGYIIQIKTNQSVPSDMILLKTSEHNGKKKIQKL